MLIVIKIGTDSVIGNIPKIVKDAVAIKDLGHDVIIVSSGAVGMGRAANPSLGSTPVEKQILASIGQIGLIKRYQFEFTSHNYFVGQILMTKKDVESRMEIDNLTNMISEMLARKNIIPVVNENDSIALRSLMFTDNDEIAGTLASIMNADKLIILTNVDGVYDDFSSPNRKVLDKILYTDETNIGDAKSNMGRGGMQSKVKTARKLAKLGISTTICNVLVENVMARVVMGENIGTTFIPARDTKADKLRRHLAFDAGVNVYGEIIINDRLWQTIQNSSTIFSILPVGITSFTGTFQKNDLIAIKTEDKTLIGYGLARYSSDALSNVIGKQNEKPFMRYEYIAIF
ncbi:glutamate 5-kinase [Candidatus Deianiraea vastatrix]|uniref:Glutamate 5-kinase n=1 Tax=Candidatus Deianiraea vastatrix TaxID=2163644 RepID=A0A5B8XF85_9RICK|nr:glutamate 5-kinase [Candidatus Deianiraea vastatrix]QED23585.1 Glutamate 5-kinase [Candidatus Deianiraea vastatrix]